MLGPAQMLDYSDGFAPHKEVGSELLRDSSPNLLPLVSIMIPTYRRPDLLSESLASALAQETSIPFEVVVVDNDNTTEMAAQVEAIVDSFKSPNLRLFRNEQNLGMFGNWNRCIELARSNWLTILNDDDLLKANFVEDVWHARQGAAMIAANFEHFGKILRSHPIIEIFKPMYLQSRDAWRFRNGPHHVTLSDVLRTHPMQGSLGALINKDVAIKLGGYNEDFWPSSDYVFSVRYWIEEDVVLLPDVLAAYRWQENASLNIKTLEGWLPKNFQLRNELIDNLACSPTQKTVLLHLSRIQARTDAFISRTRVNANFDSVAALRKLGIANAERFYLFLFSPLMRVLWRISTLNIDIRKIRNRLKAQKVAECM